MTAKGKTRSEQVYMRCTWFCEIWNTNPSARHKTSRDKKVHKVNDRGGVIKIVNGVYHFDLLMKTKAQCNRFGKRTGYAIIGNGTGFKQKR